MGRLKAEIKQIVYDYALHNFTYRDIIKKYKIDSRTLKKIFIENNVKINNNQYRPNKNKIIIKNNAVIKLRKCKNCNEWKELNNFYLNKNGKYRTICKECNKKENKKYGSKYEDKNKRKEQYKDKRKNREFVNNINSYHRMYRKYGKEIKRCIKCNEWKPKTEYIEYSYLKHGLCSICKDCLKTN